MTNEQAPKATHLGQYAGFVTRLIAFWLDRLIISAILGGLAWGAQLLRQTEFVSSLAENNDLFQPIATIVLLVLAVLIVLGYEIGFWLLAGQTPGKRVMGVRIVRTDGERMRLGTCVRRLIGYAISHILYLGYLWILVDNRRQGFHDKIAGTFVVYSWPEEVPVTPVRDHLHHHRRRHKMAREQEEQRVA
jgi:uncharacterized RDD family membrane protein YckC